MDTHVQVWNTAMTSQTVPWLNAHEIEEKADSLRSHFGQTKAPIDVVLLANRLGFEVYGATFAEDDISGGIQGTKESEQIIFVNTNHPLTRKRYTVAHEIAHYQLHWEFSKSFIDRDIDFYRRDVPSGDPGEKRMEVQANMFAAALLMPRELVDVAKRLTPDAAALARIFVVSEVAMQFRLANL